MKDEDITQRARELAHRIAQNLESPSDTREVAAADGDELARLRTHVAELNQRLVQIESNFTRHQPQTKPSGASPRDTAPTFAHAPAQFGTGGTYVSAVHPSGQRFNVGDAITELVDYFETSSKTCDLEPGDKPCDNCAMCSARGF